MPNLSKSILVVYSIFILAMAISFTVVPSEAFTLSISAAPKFSTPVKLSGNSNNAQFPNVQSVGAHVYVSWTDESGGIQFTQSSNYGKSFAATQNLSGTLSGAAQYPLMSAIGPIVYVVWSQGTSPNIQLYIATSVNNGTTFRAPVEISNGSAGDFVTPVIASQGDSVYVAYLDNAATGGIRASYVTCSNATGAKDTWTRPWYIGQREPQIAASGGNDVYVVADWNITVSSDNCMNWTDHTPTSWVQGILIPKEPWVWASGPNVYIAWETGSGASLIRAVWSNNYGKNWTSSSNLTSVPDGWAPMVWAYGGSAWVAFRANPGGAKAEVWMMTSLNSGGNWSQTSLSGKGAMGSAETFPYTVRSSDGVNVFVAWSHQVSSGYWTFVVSYSSNGGKTWTPAPGTTVSNNKNGEAGFENDVATGSISSSGTHCFAVWQYTNGGKDQVWFAHS